MTAQVNMQSLQGLLRFALEYTKHEDAPNVSLVEKMDPERRQFLECAIKCMTSDVENLQQAVCILEAPSSTNENILNSLNIVRGFVDNIDCANNFIKVGGLKIILDYIKNNNLAIKTCALYIIAEMSQNNPVCQEHFVNAGVIPCLVSYVQCEEVVSSSSLHAISAITRNYPPGCMEFLKADGIRSLIRCIDSRYPKVFVKACFLVRALSVEHLSVRDEFVKLSTIEIITNYLEMVPGFDLKTETVLSALCVLSDSAEGMARLLSVKVAAKLLTLVKINSGKPECEDIIEHANILLERLDKGTPSTCHVNEVDITKHES